MKTFNQNQNNKWFLTVALLGALVLNSGLWQIKQGQMKSSDFSSTDPSKIYEDLKAKKKNADDKVTSTKAEFEKAKADYDKGSGDRSILAEALAKLKIDMEEKKRAHTSAVEEQAKATTEVTSFEEGLRKITTTAGVALPGVKCESEECKKNEALLKTIADLTKKVDEANSKKDEPKAKSKDEEERERTKEELDRVSRICRDSGEEKMLRCLTQELIEVLDRNKGDKKLVKELVLRFYRDKVEEQLRTDMMATNASTVNGAVTAMNRFERALPSEYNYLREEVIDTARQAGKQLAANSQDYYKAALKVRTSDPELANYYLRMHRYTRDLFSASTSLMDRGLSSSLSAARKDRLVSDSWVQSNYMHDWLEPMQLVKRGLFTNPNTLKIADEDDYAIQHLYETALTRGLNLGSNVTAARSRGRSAGTRLGTTSTESVRLGDTVSGDISFGKLGTTSGRTRSGRTVRPGL